MGPAQPGYDPSIHNAAVLAARTARGMSQRALAAAAGVSLATVQNVERTSRQPTPGTMRAVAKALAVEVEQLFPIDTRVSPPTAAPTWPPPLPKHQLAVDAYRAAGDTQGAAELLRARADRLMRAGYDDPFGRVHPETVRKLLNEAGCRPRPKGGSRVDGVESLASFGRRMGAGSIEETVEAALAGRIHGPFVAFVEDLDCPILRNRWAVRPGTPPDRT